MNSTAQTELIHQVSTWMHFIGGYYSSTQKFINEAEKYGVSRRAPYQAVKGMNFGDRMVFLRYYNKTTVSAFAEGLITGITLDHEIAQELGDELKRQGKAEYTPPASGGGSIVMRECGSFTMCGSWSVTCSLGEIMELAEKIAKEKDLPLSVMVNAKLTMVYPFETLLSPAPKFSRGFSRGDGSKFVAPDNHNPEQTVYAISNYRKAERPKRAPNPQKLLPEGV